MIAAVTVLKEGVGSHRQHLISVCKTIQMSLHSLVIQ